MSYNTYEKYKDSGIEWIGEIPEHWEVKRFKYLFSLISSINKDEIDLPKIGLENIESGTGKFISTLSDFEGDGTVFKINDILFGKLRPYLAKVYLANFCGKAVGDFFVFRPTENIYPNYGSYLILSKNFIEITNSSTFGSKMPRVSWDFISNLLSCIPPFEEQIKIANFLDQKTSEIDELIAGKQRLLALYEEEKTAIINQAVTKGINPDAPMKDSGIEWLGEIPAHWEVVPAKYIFEVKDGTHDTPEYIQESDKSYPLVTSKDIKSGSIEFSECKHISKEDFDSITKRSNVNLGDIIMPMIGTVGGAVIVDTENLFAIKNVALFKTSISHVFEKFYYYILNSLIVHQQFSLESRGGVQSFVSLSLLRNMKLLKIPDSEQMAIVSYLDKSIKKVDSDIIKTQKLIDLLTEYKTALISEVVTGKIKVSN